MAIEDRIRSSVEASLTEVSSRVARDVRALVDELATAAAKDKDEAVRNARDTVARQATAEQARLAALAESTARAGAARAQSAQATRLLHAVRTLDGATALSDVLDGLAEASAAEAPRVGVFLVRQDRLGGWKLRGFEAFDSQPRAVEAGLTEGELLGEAVRRGLPTRSGGSEALPVGFTTPLTGHVGIAVPILVGGRAVAVLYAEGVTQVPDTDDIPVSWPDIIEMLARHAARCLEALTVQKTASAAAPRFWVPAAGRSGITA